MVAFGIIVPDEFIDRAPEGGFAKKYHTVQTLLADGADKSLSIGIRVWRTSRQPGCFDTCVVKRPAKLFCEPGCPVMNEVATGMEKTVPGIGELARSLLHPSSIGLWDNSCGFHLTGRQADDEQHVITN